MSTGDPETTRHHKILEKGITLIENMNLPWNFSSTEHPILYHYTSISAAKAMIETQSIWLSEHTAMNDKSEFVYARDRLTGLMGDHSVYLDTLARFCLMLAIEGLSQNTGLMLGSLTARRDDLNQWRNYASNGAGCVLGIDAAYLEHDAGVAIRTVLYDEIKADQILRSALEIIQEQFTAAPDDFETLMDFAHHTAADLFNIKHPAFADEREVRIARMLVCTADGSLCDVGGKRSDGSNVPAMPVSLRTGAFGETRYVALPLARRDGSSAIVNLGLGPTMSDADKLKHSAFFESHGITIWQSNLPYRT